MFYEWPDNINQKQNLQLVLKSQNLIQLIKISRGDFLNYFIFNILFRDDTSSRQMPIAVVFSIDPNISSLTLKHREHM